MEPSCPPERLGCFTAHQWEACFCSPSWTQSIIIFLKSFTNLVAKMAFHCYFITIIYLLAVFLSFLGIKMFFAHFLLGHLLLIYMDTHNFKAKWGAPMTTLSGFTDSDPLPFNPHFPGEDPTLNSSPPSPAWTPVKVSSTHFTPRQD